VYCETPIPGLGTLWISSPAEGATTISADGCADIILRDDQLIVAGPSTRWLLARGSEQHPTVGLRFFPGLAGAGLGIDAFELRDRILPAQGLLPAALAERGERALRALLGAAESPAARGPQEGPTSGAPDLSRAAESRYAGRLRDAALHSEARRLRWVDEVRGAALRAEPLPRLARRLGYSERQLRRRMLQTFGYGYASLRRVLRAERARDLILRGAPLATAASLAGYADQSHMAREFGRVIGAAPAQLAAASGSSGA
jgi:AraC-like DNA-binding protein